MTKPISDKAEVVLEYPDKFYIGTFERTARFDAHLDETGISLSFHRGGDSENKKSICMHIHYGLFAEILRDLAKTVSSIPPGEEAHREELRDAAEALCCALSPPHLVEPNGGPKPYKDQNVCRSSGYDASKLTPEEKEVLLLHVLE